ncbi:hypothetical protein SDC9_119568 [bioreactor metagenome]|uniref:Uncharacterized protein n=1 Tax=bioreactor metagenome TaxID=1076179 RepID=A0A645C4M0_9ZZZZ
MVARVRERRVEKAEPDRAPEQPLFEVFPDRCVDVTKPVFFIDERGHHRERKKVAQACTPYPVPAG